MKSIKYHNPATLVEALDLLNEFSVQCHVFAGGTDYVADLNEERRSPPENLVFLGNLDEMKFIHHERDACLEIGALVTHADLVSNPTVRGLTSLISMAAETVGCPAIRSIGTVGGNIATASPAGDVSTALLALDSQVVLKSRTESKRVPLMDFFIGPGQTILRPDELIYSVSIPLPKYQTTGQAFMKLGKRKAMSCAIVSCATAVAIDRPSNTLAAAKISLGSVAAKPMRAKKAESFLVGKPPSENAIEESAGIAMDECQPIDDVRGSASYRRDMVGVFVKRSLKEACRRALNKK